MFFATVGAVPVPVLFSVGNPCFLRRPEEVMFFATVSCFCVVVVGVVVVVVPVLVLVLVLVVVVVVVVVIVVVAVVKVLVTNKQTNK